MSPMDHAEDLACKLVGNWRKFESFHWSTDARPDDADQWCIVYTSNRDADVLTESNHAVFTRELEAFPETDVRPESHGHWACGYVDGFAIRVYDAAGGITPAFAKYAELATAIEAYPVLDDSDFSEREQAEADRVWSDCYSVSQRLEYMRKFDSQFEFHSFADMLGCARGKYFAGYASELVR